MSRQRSLQPIQDAISKDPVKTKVRDIKDIYLSLDLNLPFDIQALHAEQWQISGTQLMTLTNKISLFTVRVISQAI